MEMESYGICPSIKLVYFTQHTVLNFVHSVACVRSPFLFKAESYSMVGRHICVSMHVLIDPWWLPPSGSWDQQFRDPGACCWVDCVLESQENEKFVRKAI